MTSCLLLAHQDQSKKRSTPKGKNLLNLLLPLREDLISKGTKSILEELPPMKEYPFPLKKYMSLSLFFSLCLDFR